MINLREGRFIWAHGLGDSSPRPTGPAASQPGLGSTSQQECKWPGNKGEEEAPHTQKTSQWHLWGPALPHMDLWETLEIQTTAETHEAVPSVVQAISPPTTGLPCPWVPWPPFRRCLEAPPKWLLDHPSLYLSPPENTSLHICCVHVTRDWHGDSPSLPAG